MFEVRWNITNYISIDELMKAAEPYWNADRPFQALLESPTGFSLGWCEDDLIKPCHPMFCLADAYCVRLFNDEFELRWQRMPGQTQGRLVILSGVASSTVDSSLESWAHAIPCVGSQQRQYQIWGEAIAPANGNPATAEYRIGTLHLPLNLGKANSNDKPRYFVTAREYFHTAEDGNVVLLDEILTGFQ